MSFDWSERLEVALETIGRPARPVSLQARQRVAINNAYYAAYKSASSFLSSIDGVNIPTLDAHWFVIRQFRNSRQRDRLWIANTLDQMRRFRNEADYDDVVGNLPDKTDYCLRRAEQVLERLRRL